jgi:hypothetical protein
MGACDETLVLVDLDLMMIPIGLVSSSYRS